MSLENELWDDSEGASNSQSSGEIILSKELVPADALRFIEASIPQTAEVVAVQKQSDFDLVVSYVQCTQDAKGRWELIFTVENRSSAKLYVESLRYALDWFNDPRLDGNIPFVDVVVDSFLLPSTDGLHSAQPSMLRYFADEPQPRGAKRSPRPLSSWKVSTEESFLDKLSKLWRSPRMLRVVSLSIHVECNAQTKRSSVAFSVFIRNAGDCPVDVARVVLKKMPRTTTLAGVIRLSPRRSAPYILDSTSINVVYSQPSPTKPSNALVPSRAEVLLAPGEVLGCLFTRPTVSAPMKLIQEGSVSVVASPAASMGVPPIEFEYPAVPIPRVP